MLHKALTIIPKINAHAISVIFMSPICKLSLPIPATNITEIVNKFLNKRLHNSWWFGFQHSLAFLGVASIVAFYYHVRTVYIGSSYTFGQAVNCVSDPRIDREFAVASCNVVHDAYELSRQEKIRTIVDARKKSELRINLRVCSFKEENCNQCEKCFRTMI